MPQKVLKELVGVLLLYDLAGCLNDIADILDELLSIGGKSADFDEGVVANVGERFVDLFVVRVSTLAESLDYAVETELS